MSTALLHYADPALPPIGVWWLPEHQSVPQSLYRDQSQYTDGAMAVLGENYDGGPFSLGRWQYVTDRLPGLHNPFSTWLAVEYTDNPQGLLTADPASLKPVLPSA